jgi:hypothetical protein
LVFPLSRPPNAPPPDGEHHELALSAHPDHVQFAITKTPNAVHPLVPAPRMHHGLAVRLLNGELRSLPRNMVFAQALTRVVGELRVHARTLADR